MIIKKIKTIRAKPINEMNQMGFDKRFFTCSLNLKTKNGMRSGKKIDLIETTISNNNNNIVMFLKLKGDEMRIVEADNRQAYAMVSFVEAEFQKSILGEKKRPKINPNDSVGFFFTISTANLKSTIDEIKLKKRLKVKAFLPESRKTGKEILTKLNDLGSKLVVQINSGSAFSNPK
ncbi:MAG: hypothetical protein SNJ77_06435 [Cytophagales bacterium]